MNKYLVPQNYAAGALQVLNTYVLPALDIAMAPPVDEPLRHRPIFVVGAPRCGSTLFAQVLTDALQLGYMSNRHCQFFGAPALADRVFSPLQKKKPSDFQSTNGATRDSYGPNECGEWWYRFFRRKPAYVSLEEADRGRMQWLRQSIAALTNAQDKPILLKNLYASLRLQPILSHIPEALIVVVKRDELDNAHSLLEGRMKLFGSYSHWWSVEPPNTDSLNRLPPHAQVVEQVRAIYTLIDRDTRDAQIDPGRVLHVTYENLCANAHRTVGEMSRFLAMHGVHVDTRFEVPESFRARSEVRIDEELYKDLSDYLASGE